MRAKPLIFVLMAITGCAGSSFGSPRQNTAAIEREGASLDRATMRANPLRATHVDDIARLVMLEDTRRFDEPELARMLASSHPEVRRRAALAIGRIADVKGGALLEKARGDKNPSIAQTVVFATGQLKDPAAIPWLASLLQAPDASASIKREAAMALGKFQAPEARTALATFLATAPSDARSAPRVGPAIDEALLSLGRQSGLEDLSPILRWMDTRDAGTRWRVAWALVRQRHPAAWPHLLKLSDDSSPEVRYWAMRGLAPPAQNAPTPPADAPAFDRAKTSARLRAAMKDPDRQVRTEALRALAQHDDDESFAIVLAALDSPDSWLSVSAAEAMGRFQKRADVVVPKLIEAAGPSRPLSLRLTALTPLTTLAPEQAIEIASALARVDSMVARTSARQALGRLGEAAKIRLDALVKEGVLPAGAANPPRPAEQAKPSLSEADYRRIVERWVVPYYNRNRPPRSVWQTPRGSIELELYPEIAPLGVEHFVRVVESGEIVGTEFGRVVPNFVAQQRAIRNDMTLRDEVSPLGLPAGNLSWASAGLDTGRPGYTLGVTRQPHNEGNFTALGRIMSGMDVVARLELGDKVTAAKMVW